MSKGRISSFFSKDALQFMLLSIYDNKKALDNILMHTVLQLTLEKYDRKQILELFDVYDVGL